MFFKFWFDVSGPNVLYKTKPADGGEVAKHMVQVLGFCIIGSRHGRVSSKTVDLLAREEEVMLDDRHLFSILVNAWRAAWEA